MPASIPLQSIEAIRLTCRHCGVALILPFETAKEVPSKCFNCCHPLPGHALHDFMREFKCLQTEAKRADVNFIAHLEQRE